MTTSACPLCNLPADQLLWSNGQIHVIAVDDSRFPGYTRVVWDRHQTEMTDLEPSQRNQLMQVVWQVEQTQRQILSPDKINLAQFGNVVPHLHWHVIPRWRQDSHFPEPVWAAPSPPTPQRQSAWENQQPRLVDALTSYHQALANVLSSAAIGT